jgi:hypothetical protein
MPLTSNDYLELWARAVAEPHGIAITTDSPSGLMVRLNQTRPPSSTGWHLTNPASHPSEVWVLPPNAQTLEPGLPSNDPPRRRNDLDLADDD